MDKRVDYEKDHPSDDDNFDHFAQIKFDVHVAFHDHYSPRCDEEVEPYEKYIWYPRIGDLYLKDRVINKPDDLS